MERGKESENLAVKFNSGTLLSAVSHLVGGVRTEAQAGSTESKETPGPVWQSNNHSDYEIRWNEGSADQVHEVSAVVCTYFGLQTVTAVEKVDRVENHSHNFRVQGMTGDGESVVLFLKKSIRETRPAALNVIGKMYDYLRGRGVPTQENILASSGARCVSHNGFLWQAFTYVDGHHYRGTEDELRVAAESVAEIHGAFAEAPPELLAEIEEVHPSRVRKWSPEQLERVLVEAEEAVRMGRATPRQQVLAKYADYIRAHAARGSEAAPQMQGARRQLGKGTVHPQDFIFKDGKLQAFIDVEEMEQTELVRDVATALHRQVRQYMVYNKLSSPEDLLHGVSVFLDAYRAKNPLSKSEVLLIPVFLRDSLLNKVMSASTSKTYEVHEDEGAYELNKFAVLLEEVSLIEQAVKKYAETQSE